MINIDARSSTPLYQQVIDEVKAGILKGLFSPGDKLPSVREMASLLTTNPNTISKAYGELERQKVIETIRGRGTYVSESYQGKVEDEKLEKIKDIIKKVVVEAQYMGMNKEDLYTIIDECFKELNN